MKTTLDLPDDLMKRVKLRAVHSNQKLKEAVSQLLELGMAVAPTAEKPAQPPRPTRLRKRGRITIDDIESAISAGRD